MRRFAFYLAGGILLLGLGSAARAQEEAAPGPRLRIEAAPGLDEEGRAVVDFQVVSNLPDRAKLRLRLESLSTEGSNSGTIGHDVAWIEGSRAEGRLGPFDWELRPGHYRLWAACDPGDHAPRLREAMGGAGARPVVASAEFAIGTSRTMDEALFEAKVAAYEDLLRIAACHGRLEERYRQALELRRAGRAVDAGVLGSDAELLELARSLRSRRNDTRGDPLHHATSSLMTLCRSLLGVGACRAAELSGHPPGSTPPPGEGAALEGIEGAVPMPAAEGSPVPTPAAAPPGAPDPGATFLAMLERVRHVFALAEMELEWARYASARLGVTTSALLAALESGDPAAVPGTGGLEDLRTRGTATLALLQGHPSLARLEIAPEDVERRQALLSDGDAVLALVVRVRAHLAPPPAERVAAAGGELRSAVEELRSRVEGRLTGIRFAREAEAETPR